MNRQAADRLGTTLLLRELRRHRGALVRIGLWSAVEALPALVSGLVVSAAIDRFLAGQAMAGLGFLALLLVAAAVGAVATRQMFPWLASVVEPVRDTFVTAIVAGVLNAAAGPGRTPDAASVVRLTEQVESVRNTLFALLRTVRRIAFTFVAVLIGLAVLAPAAALTGAVLVLLALVLFALLLPGLAGRYRDVLLAEEEVARRAGSTFGGLRDAIACAGADRAIQDVRHAVDDHADRAVALARNTAARTLVVFVGGQLPLVVLLVAAPWLIRDGHLSFGELVGAATYLMVSLEPSLRGMVQVVGTLGLDLVVNLRRIGQGLVATSPAPAGAKPAPDVSGGSSLPIRHDLTVRGLTFAYGPHAAPVVHDLDLTVTEGGHLAIVGSSGIGKSTLASLLAGLLTPEQGTVRLGGRPIDQIPTTELRRLLALIPQEAYVFAGTLRENLTYLAPDADDAALAGAAEVVGLSPMVERLDGFDALVGAGGAQLSSGEKQLIALTRVYLSPARIVILDEATANLDPVAEGRAEAAFMNRPGSLLVIAHRISSARRADQILILDGNRPQFGSHDELVRASARYADLVGHWESSAAAASPQHREGPDLAAATT